MSVNRACVNWPLLGAFLAQMFSEDGASYIFAEGIRKPCRHSLEQRFTRRVSETIFGETRLHRKTRTSRILSVSVALPSCDSVRFHDYEMFNALTRCFETGWI